MNEPAPPSMESPNGTNVVVVVVDTLRYDHVGANAPDGSVETPNLDAFAAESWSFSNAYISGFPTIAARRDMLTGRYGAPFNTWTPMGFDRPTLPGALADVGYVTQLIHDTPHLVNGGHRFDVPFHAWTQIRGAEVDRPWITDSWEWPDNWARDERFEEYGISDAELFGGSHSLPRYVQANRDRDGHEDWNVARLFETASSFLADNADRENFFLWVDCFDPHEPWDAPPEFVDRYDPGGDGHVDPRSFTGTVRNDPDLGGAAAAHLDAQYKAKVSFLDERFGAFIETLESTGLAENTAVVVTGDHGTNLGDQPGRTWGKSGPPLQNEAHVPLFVRLPDGDSGRCDALVQPQDLFATVADIAGAPVPEGVESHALHGVAREGRAPRPVALSGQAGSFEPPEAEHDDVLFTAYDGEWCLGVTLDPGSAPLWRIGDHEDASADNPDVVEELYAAAVAEVERRGLDPALAQWLRRGGGYLPADARTTDAPSHPPGWELYWNAEFYR